MPGKLQPSLKCRNIFDTHVQMQSMIILIISIANHKTNLFEARPAHPLLRSQHSIVWSWPSHHRMLDRLLAASGRLQTDVPVHSVFVLDPTVCEWMDCDIASKSQWSHYFFKPIPVFFITCSYNHAVFYNHVRIIIANIEITFIKI